MSGSGTVRSRQGWAAIAEHAEAFPGHISVCPECERRFDRQVNPATGLHHSKRRADYCSDTCQNIAKKARAKGAAIRTTTQPPLHPPPSAQLTEVRAILSKVRHDFVLNVYWSPLYRNEWAILQSEAPDIAVRLSYYESASRARDIASAGLTRLGRAYAEDLRKDLVARIESWFRDNSF